MKKFKFFYVINICFVISVCFTLMACTNNQHSSTKVEQGDLPTELGDDLSEFIIKYDNDIYKMPILVSDLLNNGWKIITDISDSEVPAYESGIAYITKNNITINTRPENRTDTQIAIEKCYITSLVGNNSFLKVPITLPKGITIGMTQSDLELALESIDYEKTEHYSLIYYKLFLSDSNREYIDITIDKDLDGVSEIVVCYDSEKNKNMWQ